MQIDLYVLQNQQVKKTQYRTINVMGWSFSHLLESECLKACLSTRVIYTFAGTRTLHGNIKSKLTYKSGVILLYNTHITSTVTTNVYISIL